MNKRKIMLIAGEASGDKIAARAIRAARELVHDLDGDELEIFGIAGDECAAEGMHCYHSVREMSVVGFVEVARRFRFFKSVLHEMEGLLKSEHTRPDVLVLVDYPGFNIRLAHKAKALGVRVVYYVSPQVWAWHKERVHELRKVVDTMLVIFPFEENIYRDAGLKDATFIGHPLLERIESEESGFSSREAFASKHKLPVEKEWLLIFSGSRSEEVRRLLPTFIRAARKLAERDGLHPILVEAPSIDAEYYSRYLEAQDIARFRSSEAAHELMYHAKVGILKSGTTTLEAALLGLPGVICYKTHPLTFQIAKRMVKLPYIGLANIVLQKKLYPELLQHECTAETIVSEIERILKRDTQFRAELHGLASTLKLRDEGPSMKAARAILGIRENVLQ